jgi:hypothetical protein
MQLLLRKTSFDAFLPHIMAVAHGDDTGASLPPIVVQSFVRNSAIDFAQRTGVIRRKIVLDVQEGLTEYPILPDDCEQIIRIIEVCVGGICYAANEDSCCSGPCGCGLGNFSFDGSILKLTRQPTEDIEGRIVIKAVVAPSRQSCEIDDVVYQQWHDAIVNGALHEIHLIPGKPWSSANAADYRLRKFNDAISSAKIRVALGNTNGRQMAIGMRFV